MSDWTLDFTQPDDEPGWVTIARRPSGDACKTEAKRWYDIDRRRTFRIYDPLGRLVFYSVPNNGWRMRWKWGDFSGRSAA